jgi:hypothetical protein
MEAQDERRPKMTVTAWIVTLAVAVVGAFYLAFGVYRHHPVSTRGSAHGWRIRKPHAPAEEHHPHDYLSFGGE